MGRKVFLAFTVLFTFIGVLIGKVSCYNAYKKSGDITIYYSVNSFLLAHRIATNEVGLKVKYTQLNSRREENKDGNYNDKIDLFYNPILKFSDGTILTNDITMMIYFAENYKDRTLLGKDKYKTVEWLIFAATELRNSFYAFSVATTKRDNIFQKANIEKKLEHVNEALKKNKYLTGDQFTIADAYIFAILKITNFINIDLSKYQEISRFMADISKRDAVVKSITEENSK